MTTLTRKKESLIKKTPEIERLLLVMRSLGIKTIDIANKTDIAERTITNFIWNNKPIGAHLLRALHANFGVSVDWLLSGQGAMLHNSAGETVAVYTVTDQQNQRTARMLAFITQFMQSASDDEQAWLEMQVKLHVPQYAQFLDARHE